MATPMSSDLRWNNVGLLGGRSLLEALQNNSSLVGLEVAGNNVPGDTLRALGETVHYGMFDPPVSKSWRGRLLR